MKYFLSKVLLVAVLFTAAISCSKDEAAKPTNTLAKLIADNPDLSLFNAAIAKAKLTNFTEGVGPFTILAPNNAAFNAIGINSAADLSNIDSNALVTLLAYHIIPAARAVIDLPKGPNAPISTQNAGTLYEGKYPDGSVFFNGAKLASQDLMATNGVLHVISRVLTMPVGNALVNLQANSNYKLFVQAITKAALTASFTAAGPITVFAPTNAAMTAGGWDSTAIANSTATILTPIVRYHIHNARLFSSEFKTGTLKMLSNVNTTIDATNKTIKGNTNPSPLAISATDWLVSNGVIHTIGGVLKP
jgi:uncharacterized surface protein with fasciclin (FAS1) repeats